MGGRAQGDETSLWDTPPQKRTSWTAEADYLGIAWAGRACELHLGQHRDAQTDILEESGQEALQNDFDVRQGKAEAIEDCINREEMMS